MTCSNIRPRSFMSTAISGWVRSIPYLLRSAALSLHTSLTIANSSNLLWNTLRMPLKCRKRYSEGKIKPCGRIISCSEKFTSWTKISNRPWNTSTNPDKWWEFKTSTIMKPSPNLTYCSVKVTSEPDAINSLSIQLKNCILCSETIDKKKL